MRMNFARWAVVFALCLGIFSTSARADNWKNGDLTSYGQAEWVSDPNAISLFDANFNSVYASDGGALQVGIPGSGGFSLVFTNAGAIQEYLPASGPAGALDADLGNPTSSLSGIYGGDVTALALNVDFSAAGLLPGTSGLAFGNLYLTGFEGTSLARLDGLTVSQLLAINETALGGGTTSFSIADLQPATDSLNDAFVSGLATGFGDDHLTATNPNGGSSGGTAVPEPSGLLLLASGLLPLGALCYQQRRHGSSSRM